MIATAALCVAAAQTPEPAADAPNVYQVPPPDDGPKVPEGFTRIFNGKDLTGWHVSKTNHHGTTPDYHVLHGLIVGTQNPRGKGGILLTDKKYKNFEVYIEVKPDWGCDSGLFLRSSEAGEAYQVTLDYLPGGGMGGIYGERLKGVTNANVPAPAADLTPGAARRAGPRARRGLAKGLEARSLELGARPHRGRRAADQGLDQRPARDRFQRHRQPRGGRRHRRHDRHPDALHR